MTPDALCLAAMAQELRQTVVGGRVDKISQPNRFDVVLAIHGQRENFRLLLSAQPGSGRAALTGVRRDNPAQPPVFCMLLRKHLTGARLLEITQPTGERLLRFTFSFVTELGDQVPRHLILEAMGSQANLILTDGEDRVLCCIRRVEGDLTQGKRQVMPGLFYQPPPPHPGVPPLIARELEFLGRETPEAGMARYLDEIARGQYTPTLLVREGKPFAVTFTHILQYGPAVDNVDYPTFGAALDDFFLHQETAGEGLAQVRPLRNTVRTLRDRAARKLENQSRELEAARDRETLRLHGELLTANLHRLSPGAASVTLENYYDPEGGTVDIPLDPRLTPQQNAAKYFKDYQRAKTAEDILTRQLDRGREELRYLDSVLASLDMAESQRDLDEIRRELLDFSPVFRRKNPKKAMKNQPIRPLELTTSTGFAVLVGKTGTQNDYLTCKLAQKQDIWFHVQKRPGSHVILRVEGTAPDDKTLEEAAAIAAFYSQADRGGGQVPVDYTPVKYVKKPAGARPGMVVYTTYRTAYVAPALPGGRKGEGQDAQ